MIPSSSSSSAVVGSRRRRKKRSMWLFLPIHQHPKTTPLGVLLAMLCLMYMCSLLLLSSQLVTIPSESFMIRTPLLSPTKDTVAQNNDNGDNNKPWTLTRWDAHVQYHQQERRRRPSFSKPITAYLEPDWNVTERIVPTSSSSSDNLSRNIYYEPLPLRNQSPKDLKRWVYPHAAHTCRDIPSKLPIDKGPPPLWNNNDTTKQSILWNTLASPIPLQKLLQTELPHCPVDGDPYLPWIHDVFVSNNDSIQIIAQNKRRCNTGSDYSADLERLEPQVALFQPVSVQRITQIQAEQLAPTLWKEEDPNHSTAMRYRLTSIPQADAPFTRFVCQFHTWSHDHARIELGETFSEYNFNYEYVDFLKNKQNHPGLLSKQGKDNGRFWASTLMFSCPLPTFLKGSTNIAAYDDDNYLRMPLLHLDIIPIRVPPRFPLSLDDPGYYFKQDMVGPEYVGSFDPLKAWGTHHVLPHIKASGRWTNLPICPVPQQQQQDNDAKLTRQSPPTKKKHFLSACLWASASYETRGVNRAMTDTKARLLEWIEFHLLVGFDHIYIYDNSGAHHNANINDTLQDIVDRFGSKKVTRIDWPSVVCNNNIPAHDNTGERSSQYAAEHSCLLRFGSQTEWMATFDTDEYLVPLGNFTSFQQVLDPTQNPRMQDTRILSFRSTRGKLKFTASEQVKSGREMLPNVTFLEAYNCDGSQAPRPEWADRARKQVYRTDYVLSHFVHYSTVTTGYLPTYKDLGKKYWTPYYEEQYERVTDELEEATMIHAKSLDFGQTVNWQGRCVVNSKRKRLGCYIGFPWPKNQQMEELPEAKYDPTSKMEYNCFVNEKVDQNWIPRLEQALEKRKPKIIDEQFQ